ncbi:hypothetical protein RF11_06301 [Thelohanellus kitauei]|uniref:Uncharacterized protein n=1 Tax=Thelohanellus kitauei TaxID=669202 RepID=A0A0C2IRN4_THEKT|nr:hypothetical protein RF11_06301 [Thelohanellus kitauei]
MMLTHSIVRQRIRTPTCKCKVDVTDVRSVCQSNNESLKSSTLYSNPAQFDRISCDTPCTSKTHQNDETQGISTKTLNPDYQFYYLNIIKDRTDSFKNLPSRYKDRRPYCVLPKVLG